MSKIKSDNKQFVAVTDNTAFDVNCTACSRLSAFLTDLRVQYPDYHNRPVPAFGDANAQFLVIGLAPGLHGANATGRPFTGDYAGDLLYSTLYKYGFSNKPYAVTRGETQVVDGLVLTNCRISNAVKCLPPGNKPTTQEINTCNSFLAYELSQMPNHAVLLTLGLVAHKATLKATGYKQSAFKFVHGASHELEVGDKTLHMVNSYHCSRYNTNTKRLTEKMFHQVFAQIKQRLGQTA